MIFKTTTMEITRINYHRGESWLGRRQAGRQADNQKGREAYGQASRQQISGWIGRHIDGQTGRWTRTQREAGRKAGK